MNSREAADQRNASLMNSLHRRPLVTAPVRDVAQVLPATAVATVAAPRVGRTKRVLRWMVTH